MPRRPSETSQRIVEAVRNWHGGPLGVAEVSDLAGLQLNASFRTILTSLVNAGQLCRVGRGLYEAVPAKKQSAAQLATTLP